MMADYWEVLIHVIIHDLCVIYNVYSTVLVIRISYLVVPIKLLKTKGDSLPSAFTLNIQFSVLRIQIWPHSLFQELAEVIL